MGVLDKVARFLWSPEEYELTNFTKALAKTPRGVSMDDFEFEYTRERGVDYKTNRGTLEDYLQTYEVSVWVYICVSKNVNNIARVPLKIWKRKPGTRRNEWTDLTIKEPNHPLVKLIQKPNPWMGEFEFKQSIVGNLELGGNTYIEMVNDPPTQLYSLLPYRTKVIPDPKEFIKGYLYEVQGSAVRFEADDIMHIKYWHPRSQYYGLSPVQAMEMGIITDLNASTYNKNFFNNSARPDGMLATDQELSTPAWNRLKREWQQAHGGVKQAHRIAIGEMGLKWLQTGLNAKDMEFINSRKLSREEILGAFGVPPVIAGIMEYASYCLVGSTRVLTSKGWKNMANIVPGDEVYSYGVNSLTKNIVNKLMPSGTKKVYEVTDNYGHVITGSDNHPFLAYRNGGLEWVPLGELKVGDRALVLDRKYSRGRHCSCGCGELIKNNEDCLMGHEDKRKLHRLAFVPNGLCGCGCGQPTKMVRNKICNKFIHGHHTRVMNPLWKKECVDKLRASKIGVSRDSKTIAKMSLNKIGAPVWNAGLTSKDDPRVIAGDKHHWFVGAEWWAPYAKEWGNELRTKIYERDEGCCKNCGAKVILGSFYESAVIHHIDYDKSNCSEENLTTLCRSCHSQSNYNRETWKEKLLSQVGAFTYPHDNRLRLRRIMSIEYVGEEETYDIEVEGSHNFIAEGYLVHNSNSNEQKRQYWEDSIGPKLALIENRLNHVLAPKFKDPDLYIEFDMATVQAIQENRESEARVDASYVDRGIKTINEIRREKGWEPVEWGDTWHPPNAGGLSVEDVLSSKGDTAGDGFGSSQGSQLGRGPKNRNFSQANQPTEFPSERKLGKQDDSETGEDSEVSPFQLIKSRQSRTP